ncbi:SPOR domain-containing protein [Campylobacter sp. CX2-4080-23]|uniref:SPOR domain-containing protein n=1 Tax=Campylobacter porcelli TaxID=1660073 RepID=UPI002EAA62A9|nr:SPOR domain-containing protein [Campylobacter sp. CX2-4080-23]
MEENNNLQDILLDKNEEEKSGGVRKILIGVALLVIVFVVVLIIMKFLNSDNKNKNNDIADTLLLPTELPTTNTPVGNASNDLFEQVPIVSDTTNSKDSFENIVNEYKNAQATMETASNTITPVLPPKVEELFSIAEPKEVKKEPTKQEVSKNLEPKKVENKKAQTKPTEVKKTEPKKAEVKKDSVKTNASQSNPSLEKGAYIQVASVSKLDTNSALIKKIVASGYKYKTHKVVVNGNTVIKILIGPFGSDLEANMQKIRQDISNGAFVYRVK